MNTNSGFNLAQKPFTIHIPDENLARLRRKLEDTLFPEEDVVPGAGWDYGMDLAWLKDMREEWLRFDWPEAEQEMNS
jgi:hypothetical protein